MSLYNHYTSICTLRGEGLGVRVRDPETRVGSYYKVAYQPSAFVPSSHEKRTDAWRTLDGRPLRRHRYESVTAYHEATRDTSREFFGTISPVNQFLAEYTDESCGVPFEALRVCNIDIETRSKDGFAPPENPYQPITAITALVYGHYYVWGTGVYVPVDEDGVDISDHVTFYQCADEIALLKSFMKWWSSDYPDIMTGWNVVFYDAPYIANRIDRLHGEGLLKFTSDRLSPWGKIGRRTITLKMGEEEVIDILGLAILDYKEAYQKFTFTQQENYRLDTIAEVELGLNKISYDDYGSLDALAEQNYQKFINYNIYDVRLVHLLNEKQKLLHLIAQLAYGARVNYADTFRQVRLWDAIMYYTLYGMQIAVPSKVHNEKAEKYAGAFVKEPIVGKHKWVTSFDVNSLYPSIMRQWNISPDRHIPFETLQRRLKEIKDKYGIEHVYANEDYAPAKWIDGIDKPMDAPRVVWALECLIHHLPQMSMDRMLDTLTKEDDPYPFLRVLGLCMTPNKQVFLSEPEGFLPAILSRMYAERKDAKNKETALKKQAEKEVDPETKKALVAEAQQWGLQQTIRKLNLNSCYGAVGNEHHRFFDVRHAEAVTATGQVIIQYVAHELNRFLNAEFGTDRDYVIAIDTDSNYLSLDPVVANVASSKIVDTLDRYCEDVLQPIIDRTFDRIGRVTNTTQHVLAMKREAIAETGIWSGKKRYILWVHDNEGVRYDPPKLKITGIEAVRSSTPKYARDVIKKALVYMLKEDQTSFYALMDEAEDRYRAGSFDLIAMPRGCKFSEYRLVNPETNECTSKTPIQVRGALVYNHFLTASGLHTKYPAIRDGEKIRFCYLTMPNPMNSDVIAAPHTLPTEWHLDKYLDRYTQYEKTVLDPLEKLVSLIGWSIRPTASLDALF